MGGLGRAHSFHPSYLASGDASVDCMITQGHLRLVGFMLGCSCHGREIGSAVEPGLQQAGSDQRKVLANRGPVRLL